MIDPAKYNEMIDWVGGRLMTLDGIFVKWSNNTNQDAKRCQVSSDRWQGEMLISATAELEGGGLEAVIRKRLDQLTTHGKWPTLRWNFREAGRGEAVVTNVGEVSVQFYGETIPPGLTARVKMPVQYAVVQGYEMLNPEPVTLFETTEYDGKSETVKGWKWDRERGPHRVEDKPAEPFPAKIGRINKLPRF